MRKELYEPAPLCGSPQSSLDAPQLVPDAGLTGAGALAGKLGHLRDKGVILAELGFHSRQSLIQMNPLLRVQT